VADKVEAPAKVNLSLRVLGRDRSGYHLLRSLVQTVDWFDTVEAERSSTDELEAAGHDIEGDNLIWRAVRALRERSGNHTPLRFHLDKRIPVAAGLGGGSADAAAALLLASRILGVGHLVLEEVAPSIGADVPFCLRGGIAMMEGRGDRLTPLPFTSDFAVAIVTPPFSISTAAVYATWDRVGAEKPREVSGRTVPPSLREFAPLVNDLEAAARSLEPDLGDWIEDLERRWNRSIALTGSGPSLFAFFFDEDEALSALEAAPPESRARAAAVPLPTGVRLV
jgi:4-diphosphocytidyl-2-C-methyl-D-erythritol kinase